MRKGLENPNITGAVRESLQAALKKAEEELADKTRGQAAVERLQAHIERAKPTFEGKSGDEVLSEMRGSAAPKKAPSDIKRFSWANYPLSKKFMPKHQQRVVSDMGEERESVLGDVEAMLAKIPRSQENNDDPIVFAHYFYGQSDWFVLEYLPDREDSDYDRFFGFTILNGDSQMAELGYMPVVEFANSNRVELDFYWKPKPLSEAKANADPEMWGKKKNEVVVDPPQPKEKDENGIVELYFPKASKLDDLGDYKEQFWARGYDTERANILKELVLDKIEWDKISKNLIESTDYWNDENNEPIGGSYSDDARLDGKSFEQIAKDRRLVQIYRDSAVTNVVKVLNKDTGETFYVNTEGYNYARYVGFDKAPEKKTEESPIPAKELELVPFKFGINTYQDEIGGERVTVIKRDPKLNGDVVEWLEKFGFNKTNSKYEQYAPEIFEGPISVPFKERIIKAVTDSQIEASLKQKIIEGVAKADSVEAMNPYWGYVERLDLVKYRPAQKPLEKVKTPYFEYVIGEKSISLKTDYNPDVVAASRKLNGKWSGYEKLWRFDPQDLSRVQDFLREIFGTDGVSGETETVDVKVFLDELPTKAFVTSYGQSVFALGRQLAHRKNRDGRVVLGEGVTVLEGGFPDRGGSVANPRLNQDGGTVLLVRNVPKAVLEKDEMNCEGCYEIYDKAKKAAAMAKDMVEKRVGVPEQPPARILGKKRSLTLPNGQKHEAQYAVVELDSILASHDEETFADTPGYPKNAAGNNLNDRNYATDKAAQQLVEDYAQNLDPDLVLSLSSTPEGTPIITESGIVVSGNNRTMSMKLARKRYPERWKHYQAELKNELPTFFIYDEAAIASMKAPVLVRIDYDFGDLTTTNMAKYNASSMKAKSPVDKAVELSTTLREQALCETRIPDILNEFDTLSEFYASVSATQRIIKALQQCSVFNEQDVAAYVDKGMLTEDGKTLLETVLAALILQPNTLRTANRDGVRALRQAVVNALPALLANKSLPSERTLVPLINAAIDQQAAFVASGLSYCDFIMQGNLFGESETDPRVFALNRLMVSGQKRFRDAITKYSDNQKGQQGTSMFADQSVSPQEAFEAFIFKSLSAADQECIVNWNKRRTDAPAATAPKVEAEKPTDDLTVLKTRLKLLEKRLPSLEGEQKTIIQTRIKLLRKKTGQ